MNEQVVILRAMPSFVWLACPRPCLPCLPAMPTCLLKLAPLGSNAVGRWVLLLPCNDSCPIHSHSRSIVTAIRPPRGVPAASVLNVLVASETECLFIFWATIQKKCRPLWDYFCCPIDALRFIASLAHIQLCYPPCHHCPFT